MAKAKFERTKPHCNIGTIGHAASASFAFVFVSCLITVTGE